MRRIIGIGDLVVDFYYLNNKLLGICGGKTTSNIIANLSNMGFNTTIFGGCGNDIYGEVTIDSLDQINVDTSNIIKSDVRTRKFHISINTLNNKIVSQTKKRCPICGNKDWYSDALIDPNNVINSIQTDDIIVIDNLNEKNRTIIEELHNKIMIDIGYYQQFLYLKPNKIIDMISNKFTIINMNERVANYLFKRFHINNGVELFKLLKTELLIVTKGKNGADFIFDDIIIPMQLIKSGKEIDTNGAGDAFFATIIAEYVNNDLKIDKKMIDRSFEKATTITKEVVSKIGARSHLCNLYKVEEINNVCTCHDLVIIDK